MNKAISISREFGSGGRAIGKILADRLGYTFYDSHLVDLAAQKANIPLINAQQADERAINPWFYTPIFGGLYNNYSNQSDSERIFRFETEVIREEALKGNCVFVGRAANYALEDLENVQLLSYFIYAPEEWRIKRLIETEGFENEREAETALRKKDKQRRNFYDYFTGKEYKDSNNYDLCIDSSFLGIDKTAEFLVKVSDYLFANFRDS